MLERMELPGGWMPRGLRRRSRYREVIPAMRLRVCLKIPRGAVFVQRAGWRGVTKEDTLHGSSTEEQRSQTTLCTKILRTAVLLSLSGVGSVGTARCGDLPMASPARTSPPWPKPKSQAAAPLAIFSQSLSPLGANPLKQVRREQLRFSGLFG